MWERKGSETNNGARLLLCDNTRGQRSGCYRSGSSVLYLGFQAGSFTYTYLGDLRYTQFRHEQNVTVTGPSRAQILRKSRRVYVW